MTGTLPFEHAVNYMNSLRLLMVIRGVAISLISAFYLYNPRQ
jgi:hypothetical protein